jgi:20S proteasome alpha/beta subunit
MTMKVNTLGKTRKYRPVTIIVGIICKGGIVVASDSQSTAWNVKRTDSTKISHSSLAGQTVLIAQSGDCTLSSRAVEILENLFNTAPFDDYRKPADLAQNAIALTKKELGLINNWDSNSVDQYLNDNPFSLMLAYYHQTSKGPPEPYLYVLNSTPGFATIYRNYVAIGCGGTVGQFILGRSGVCDMEPHRALIAAIYTVEEVKKVDAYCGGPTKAAVLSVGGTLHSSELVISCAVEAMQNYEEETKQNWNDLMQRMIDKINKHYKDRGSKN